MIVPEVLHGGAHNPGGCSVATDVDRQDVDVGVGRSGLLQGLLTATHSEYVCARLGEGDSGGSTDAGPCAGDDRDMTGEAPVGGVRGHQGSLFDVRCT